MAIPKLIHQTAADVDKLPAEITKNFERIRAMNPEWKHMLYDDKQQIEYLRAHLTETDFEALAKLNPKYGVVRADLFRYLVIYNEGGVYLDIKSDLDRPLNEVIKPEHDMLLSQWENHIGDEYEGAGYYPELARIPGGEFQQWHVVASPGHPFLKAAVDDTLHNIRTYSPAKFGVGKIGVLRLSGPICYTLAIRPLLEHYPCQIVNIRKLGFRYSLYEKLNDKDRHARSPSHYSNMDEPIILKEKYFDLEEFGAANIGEILANILRENSDLALKLAVLALVVSASIVGLIILLALYAFA